MTELETIPHSGASASAVGGTVSALLEGSWPDFELAAMDPADGAAALLARGQADLAQVDEECLSLLNRFYDSILDAPADELDSQMLRLSQLLGIVLRLRPQKTVVDLHRRFMRWNGFFSNFVVDASLDLRREYWRLLAATQDAAAEAGISPRRLMPMWLSICTESGGLYHQSYLRVGLMGLRRLPLGNEFSSNEAFALQGLARWAMKRRPGKDDFMRQWHVLEGDFPRSAIYWQTHVEAAVAAAEHELREETGNPSASFPAAQWWRNDVDVGDTEIKKPLTANFPQPVAMNVWKPVFDLIPGPFIAAKSRIERIVLQSRKHADLTGDVFYVVRTCCKFGMELIRTGDRSERARRGELAAELARTAMDYQSGNEFAWSLYRDALAAQGRLLDAELVGWETIRRFPSNAQWRNQLATVLAEQLGKPDEAEALLRETIALFPQTAHARTQLATVLAEQLGKPDEAAALLRETIALFPQTAHARNQLATVLVDDLHDKIAARGVLLAARTAGADNQATASLLAKLEQGRKLRGSPKAKGAVVESLPQQLDLPGASARRQLFLVENGLASPGSSLESLRKLSRSDYVTFAIDAISSDKRANTTFSQAFVRAAREGSAEALRALIRRANAGEKALVESAISVFEQHADNRNNSAPPPGMEKDNVVVLSSFIETARGKQAKVKNTIIQSAAGALLDIGPISLAA